MDTGFSSSGPNRVLSLDSDSVFDSLKNKPIKMRVGDTITLKLPEDCASGSTWCVTEPKREDKFFVMEKN